jgi:hypothetical protein
MFGVELGQNRHRQAPTSQFEAEIIEEIGTGSIGVHYMLSYIHCMLNSV